MSKKFVIIDTDAGIDDALALILATNCQNKGLIEILAITCTHGNTSVDNVCKNVSYTLKASNLENIKIYKGCESPIIGHHVVDPVYGEDGLGGATKNFPKIDVHIESEHAVNALVRLAKQYPKQVSLLALGPLTNIAMAYMLDNQFFNNLEQIVYMGGTVDNIGNIQPSLEFNVATDPEACNAVLTNVTCPITLVPWECGVSNLMTWDIYEKMIAIKSEKAKFVQSILAKDYETLKKESNRKGFVLCDILAIVAFVYPELIEKTEQFPTAIELNGQLTRGQLILDKRTLFSYFDKSNAPNVRFIRHFDESKLNELLLSLVQ